MQHKLYLVRFSLPDGKHIMVQNSHPSVAEQHARAFIALNPDGKFESIEPVRDENHVAEAEAALRAENPNRLLANDLGLDTANRILNDPQIARDLAAAQQQGEPASRGGGCC